MKKKEPKTSSFYFEVLIKGVLCYLRDVEGEDRGGGRDALACASPSLVVTRGSVFKAKFKKRNEIEKTEY